MKSFFTLGLSSSGDQKSIIDLLQSQSAKVIQTSSGLFIGVNLDATEFLKKISEHGFKGPPDLAPFDISTVSDDTPKDISSFIKNF